MSPLFSNRLVASSLEMPHIPITVATFHHAQIPDITPSMAYFLNNALNGRSVLIGCFNINQRGYRKLFDTNHCDG